MKEKEEKERKKSTSAKKEKNFLLLFSLLFFFSFQNLHHSFSLPLFFHPTIFRQRVSACTPPQRLLQNRARQRGQE